MGAYWIALLLQVTGISCFVDEDSYKNVSIYTLSDLSNSSNLIG